MVRALRLPVAAVLLVLPLGASLPVPRAAAQPGEIQRVGAWPYGPARAVGLDLDRSLVFLGSGGVCLILDGSSPAAPVLISDDLHTQGLVEDVAYDAAHQRLFLACGEGGFEIWDVSDPAQPARLSLTEVLYFGYDTPVGGVQLWDHYAIVECEWGYVHSLDVSDPAAPVDVSFNGQMGNPARDIHVSTDGQVHSTGADRYQRLAVFADGSLHNSGYKDFTYGPVTVYGKPDVAYVGYGGLCWIIDLLVGGWPIWNTFDPGGVGDIQVPGPHAYICNGSGLHIWDVSVPNSPVHAGSALAHFYAAYRLAVSPEHGYIAANTDGLQIAAIRDPTFPQWIGHYDVPGYVDQTATDGVYAYVAHTTEGLMVLELGDQTRPVEVGHLPLPGGGRDVVLRGGLAYTADDDAALRIVDVIDPANPALIGSWGTGGWRVALDGDLAVCVEPIANEPFLVHTVDISDPVQPSHRGTLVVPGLVWGLAAEGGYAYVSVHQDVVHVVDLGDPSAPGELTALPVPDPREVRIENGRLYVASGDPVEGGLFIYDLADPAAPALLGHYTTLGFRPFHLDVEGDYAYLSEGTDLELLFIGDPAAPVRLDEYTMPGDLFGIHARDRYVYVSDGAAGLQIVENTLFDDPTGGLEWHAQGSGTALDLTDLDFVDRSRGWVVGDGGTILHTEDGGATWTPQASGTTAGLGAVDFVDAQNGWAVGSAALRTTDGGATWLPLGLGTGTLLTDVRFVSPDRGWIVGDDGLILATTDGGATWQPQSSGTTVGIFAVDFVDALHGCAVTAGYGEGLRTVDGGQHWTPVNMGSGSVLFDVEFATAQIGWAVGMFGEILYTSSGGATWVEQQGVHPPDWLYDVAALSPQEAWTVGFAGKVMRTTDGGNVWEAQSTGSDNQLNAIRFTDRGHGWCCGDFGTILAWGAGPATPAVPPDVAAVGPETAPVLAPGRPNPFRTSTEITFTLPQRRPASLCIFDVGGRLVKRLVSGELDEGSHRVVWDGTDDRGGHVGAGIYFAVLRSGAQPQSRSVVLLR